MGAPITGMIVLGVVQTLLALSTISPTLSEQFSALVNLAVVTNVIPYIIALSALMVMMKRAQVAEDVYKRNVVIACIAMVYSVFALYASGKEAVIGGMLVLGVAYIIWGFIAPRFAAAGDRDRRHAPRDDAVRRAGEGLTSATRRPRKGEQSCNSNDPRSRDGYAAAARAAQPGRRRPRLSPRRCPQPQPRSTASRRRATSASAISPMRAPFSFRSGAGVRRTATRVALCEQRRRAGQDASSRCRA